MSKQKALSLNQLDRKIQTFDAASAQLRPQKGWIHAMRSSLNMTLEQLGTRLGITKQGAHNLELSEASQSISLKSLNEVANAMDMTLVYGLVPKDGTLDKLVERKARELATKIVMRTNQTMILEDQGTDKSMLEKSIDDLAFELKSELKRSIWD